MADNIGTQLAAKLEEISRLHSVMSSIAVVGTSVRDYDAFQALANVVEYVEARHSAAFDEFDAFVRQRVLPIVAHINDQV